MVIETGNEVATVTQQTQNPAPGQGVIAGSGPEINARGETPGQTPGDKAYVATYYTGQLPAVFRVPPSYPGEVIRFDIPL